MGIVATRVLVDCGSLEVVKVVGTAGREIECLGAGMRTGLSGRVGSLSSKIALDSVGRLI